MFKNESVKAVALTALGVTIGILLFIGGQMAYEYGKKKMEEKKEGSETASGTGTTAGAAGAAGLRKVA